MLNKPDKNKPVFRMFPEIYKFIDNLKCPTCKKDIKEEDFRDEKSKEEYSISGMCQECQDEAFKELN